VTALSNMAAATRPPGLGDARVPCPLCGGLIHPVAGRCKHCKEDLSALRAGRPQAATPLPSLAGAAPAASVAEPVAVPAANGYAPHAGSAIPVTIPTAREGSQPILPQRPTSQWRMKAQRPGGGLVRHWPLIVIILAVLAIVAAVAIMMWPEDEAKSGKRRLSAPPAPDRMNTDPLGKQSQADPWGNPDDYVPADPPAPPGTTPHVTPDPPQQPAQPDPDDLFGGLGGGAGGTLGGGQLTGTFMLTMMHQACKKLQTCPSSNTASLAAVCSQFNSMPRPPVPANCASAQRCLDAIDALDCNAGIDNPVSALALIQDCKEAFTEC
jgi:hypothetical protein